MPGNLDETADAIPAQPEPRTSGLAIAALILGILGCLPLAGIVAVVLGTIALSKIGKSGGQLTGRGLAIGGIAAGAVTTILSVVLVLPALLLPALVGARQGAYRQACTNNLKQVGMALMSYDSDYNAFPPDISLLCTDYINNPSVLDCPAKQGIPGYVYVSGVRASDPGTCVVAFDRAGNHPAGKANVLFANGSVQTVTDAELQQALEQTRAEAKRSGREIKLVGE